MGILYHLPPLTAEQELKTSKQTPSSPGQLSCRTGVGFDCNKCLQRPADVIGHRGWRMPIDLKIVISQIPIFVNTLMVNL